MNITLFKRIISAKNEYAYYLRCMLRDYDENVSNTWHGNTPQTKNIMASKYFKRLYDK